MDENEFSQLVHKLADKTDYKNTLKLAKLCGMSDKQTQKLLVPDKYRVELILETFLLIYTLRMLKVYSLSRIFRNKNHQ